MRALVNLASYQFSFVVQFSNQPSALVVPDLSCVSPAQPQTPSQPKRDASILVYIFYLRIAGTLRFRWG